MASLLYYIHDTNSWSDTQYDNAAHTLALSYPKLPEWFTARVSLGDLRAGTGFAITYTPDEKGTAQGFLSGVYDIGTSF